MVYARRDADGHELRLGVSGMLWHDGLVMFDRASGTLWAQVTGKALRGPRRGERLEPIPSVRTTWKEWAAAHPATKVLSKGGRFVRASAYARYQQNPEALGVFGTRNPDPRLPGKEAVVGVATPAHATAVRRGELVEKGVVNAELGDAPVAFVFRGEAFGVAVFGTELDGRRLHLSKGSRLTLRDGETGTTWDALTGVATSGPLAGKRLVPYPSLEVYWFAWASTHAGSALAGSGSGGR